MLACRGILAALVLVVCCSPLASSAVVPANFTSRLDGFIRCLMSDRSPFPLNERTPELSVAVVADSQVVLTAGYGSTGSGAPITADTLFAIGSISKAFTSTVAGMLAEQGRLYLSEPVSRHVPLRTYDAYIDREASLRDLFTHHTGLSRDDFIFIFHQPDTDWRDMIKHYVPLLRPIAPFRYNYNYNNWLIAQAAYVIETIIGVPWSTYITDMLLRPIGMANTSTTWADSLKGNRATAYKNGPSLNVPAVELPTEVDAQIDLVAPAGAIQSSANDMSKWLLFQLGNSPRLINQSTLDYLHSAQVTTRDPNTPFTQRGYITPKNPDVSAVGVGYGFNWIETVWDGHAGVTHSGGTLGFISDLWHFPVDGFGWWIGTPGVSGLTISAVDLWIGQEMLGQTNIVDVLCRPQTSAAENGMRWQELEAAIRPLLDEMDERRRQHSLFPSRPASTAATASPIAPLRGMAPAAVDPSTLAGTYTDLDGPYGVMNLTLNGANNATYPLLLTWESAQMLLSPSAGPTPNVYSALIIAPAAVAKVFDRFGDVFQFDVDASGAVRGLYFYVDDPAPYMSSAARRPVLPSSSSSSSTGAGDAGGVVEQRDKTIELVVVLCIVSIILLAVLSYALLITKRYHDLQKGGGASSSGVGAGRSSDGTMRDSLL